MAESSSILFGSERTHPMMIKGRKGKEIINQRAKGTNMSKKGVGRQEVLCCAAPRCGAQRVESLCFFEDRMKMKISHTAHQGRSNRTLCK